MKDKKTELVKMLAKYAQAGIPLTPAERNLIKYLLSKQQVNNLRNTPKNRSKCQWLGVE